MTMVRVRFAPSPTGQPHIGWARTALFNWLFARHFGGTFVLRIEDTDQKRSVEGAAQVFDDAFSWLGFTYDEGPNKDGGFGPYLQSERLANHLAVRDRLLEEEKAYPCFCSPETLDAGRAEDRRLGRPPRYPATCRSIAAEEGRARIAAGEAHVIRLKVPPEGRLVVHDLIRGDVEFDLAVLDDFVLIKADGTPTYNFAAVVDDAQMAISHVLRADEHLSNTPKQLLLYQAMGLPAPAFAHVPMILAPDHSKLSKRHGATPIAEFVAQGFLPEAVVNYLMMLGWNPGGDREFLTLDEAAELFTLERVQKNPAVYDTQKMTWMNAHYLRALSEDELWRRTLPFLSAQKLLAEPVSAELGAYARSALSLVQSRVSTLAEAADAVRFFFEEPREFDPAGVAKHFARPGTGGHLTALAGRLAQTDFSALALETALTELAAELGVSRAELIHPARLAVSGKTVGPGLFEMLAVLGAKGTVDRLHAAAKMAAP